jgi:hypothetical protein
MIQLEVEFIFLSIEELILCKTYTTVMVNEHCTSKLVAQPKHFRWFQPCSSLTTDAHKCYSTK